MTGRAARPLLSLTLACGGADLAPRPSDVSPRAVAEPELVPVARIDVGDEVVAQHGAWADETAARFAGAELNRWIYATLFRTPAEDPWLGMATPTVFSGIPDDGILMR